MEKTRDVFVSHASADEQAARALVTQLESLGVTCWIAPRDIGAGSDYGGEILKGIENSTMFVLVFSTKANASKHVLREVNCALNSDRLIVPIRIDTSLPTGGMAYYLSAIQWVEADATPIPDDMVTGVLAVLEAAKTRDNPQPDGKLPECIFLNTCSRCGGQYAEHDPSGCSFHPQPPENVGDTGPDRDYAVIWRFPCCGQKYVGSFMRSGLELGDAAPPKSPGCVRGRHTPTYSFRR
jgi:hypothetical protein